MTEQEFNKIESLLVALDGITKFERTQERITEALAILDRNKQLLLHGVSQQRELLADEKCDKILQDLDEYARNYDGYEYGLPINFTYDMGELDEQRLLIKNWFKASCG